MKDKSKGSDAAKNPATQQQRPIFLVFIGDFLMTKDAAALNSEIIKHTVMHVISSPNEARVATGIAGVSSADA